MDFQIPEDKLKYTIERTLGLSSKPKDEKSQWWGEIHGEYYDNLTTLNDGRAIDLPLNPFLLSQMDVFGCLSLIVLLVLLALAVYTSRNSFMLWAIIPLGVVLFVLSRRLLLARDKLSITREYILFSRGSSKTNIAWSEIKGIRVIFGSHPHSQASLPGIQRIIIVDVNGKVIEIDQVFAGLPMTALLVRELGKREPEIVELD